MDAFVVGEVYFVLWYADEQLSYPIVDSLVFLGKNIEDNDPSVDCWYFQDTESYAESGKSPTHRPVNPGGGFIYKIQKSDLRAVIDHAELVARVNEWHKRIVGKV